MTLRHSLLVALALLVIATTTAAEFSSVPRPSMAQAVAEAMPVVVELRTRDEHEGILVESGSGSGVVVDVRGYVLTCFHVTLGSAEVTVDIEGERVPAVVLARDEFLDLALIKVDHRFPKAARWGNSSALRAGDAVFAVGYPFDLAELASAGIISGVGFQLDYPVLVTDAAVNPGNSGGGLFDLRGLLVGMPHRLHAACGLPAFTGIGFAIPGNVAHLFVIRNVPR